MASRLQDVIIRGLRADQPLATDVSAGTLYYVTDESVTERSSGTVWEDYSDGGGGGGGDVTGPASSVDDRIVTFDGVTGKLIQDGGFTIAGVVSASVAATGAVTSLTGDVTGSGPGATATTIANDAVTTAKILNDNVTYAKIQNVSATDRLLGRDTAAAGDIEELQVANGIQFTGTPGIGLTAAARTQTIGITVDGGGVLLTTGIKGYRSFPVAGTIIGWRILADQVGNITFNVFKDVFASYPSTTSIVAAAPPTMTGNDAAEDTTLTGWTTAVAAGDVFGFSITGTPLAILRATLELTIRIAG